MNTIPITSLDQIEVGDIITYKDGRKAKVLSKHDLVVVLSEFDDYKYVEGSLTLEGIMAYGYTIEASKWKPEVGSRYYAARPDDEELYDWSTYADGATSKHRLATNNVFPYTEDGKQQAIARAQEMLGIK